jgi:TRAP-type C4-dicarboxylate transport system permease small subunit
VSAALPASGRLERALQALGRFDRAWARAETWLGLGVLLAMLLVAALTAVLQVLARCDVTWAIELGGEIDWTDALLRRGTLWLAFLGMSLAAHHQQHVGIARVLRRAPARSRHQMQALSSFAASVIAVGLLIAFSRAIHANLGERPALYELLAETGSVHVCDATTAQLAVHPEAAASPLFCALRGVLRACSLPAETPGAVAQLAIPLLLLVVALRFLAHGVRHLRLALDRHRDGGDESARSDA